MVPKDVDLALALMELENHAMHRVASCYLYYLGGRSNTAALAFGSVDVYI